jgi:DNA-binding CsgD family transcriptional regulator
MDDECLTRELGMTRARIRSAVEELSAVAAVSRVITGAWSPTSTAAVVHRLRNRNTAHVTRTDRGRRHFAALDAAGIGPLDSASVRHWGSRAQARHRAAHLVAAERHEHLSINTEEVFTADSLSAARPLDRSLIDRGINLLVVERPPRDGDRAIPQHSVTSIPEGHYRQVEDVPLKLMVFDRRAALFPADPLDLEAGYIEVDDPASVQRLSAFFHRLWSSGRDPFREGVAPIDLTSREQALVLLLAEGHTDVSAAAALGVSPRTVAYAMRALMDRIGVENRFQLALLLGATGSVPASALTPKKTGL